MVVETKFIMKCIKITKVFVIEYPLKCRGPSIHNQVKWFTLLVPKGSNGQRAPVCRSTTVSVLNWSPVD